jgi:hypothetical protein
MGESTNTSSRLKLLWKKRRKRSEEKTFHHTYRKRELSEILTAEYSDKEGNQDEPRKEEDRYDKLLLILVIAFVAAFIVVIVLEIL